MTIRQLQYFASICRTQNLSASARELFVSQPTLTIAMKELEKELGTGLFVKKGTHIEVNEAGRRLLMEVEPLLYQYSRIERLAEDGMFNRQYIRLGFSTMAGSSMMPELYRRIHKKLPELKKHFRPRRAGLPAQDLLQRGHGEPCFFCDYGVPDPELVP